MSEPRIPLAPSKGPPKKLCIDCGMDFAVDDECSRCEGCLHDWQVRIARKLQRRAASGG